MGGFMTLAIVVVVLVGLSAIMVSDAGQVLMGGCGMLALLMGLGAFAFVFIAAMGVGCMAVFS